jgi:hypothetical protein
MTDWSGIKVCPPELQHAALGASIIEPAPNPKRRLGAPLGVEPHRRASHTPTLIGDETAGAG